MATLKYSVMISESYISEETYFFMVDETGCTNYNEIGGIAKRWGDHDYSLLQGINTFLETYDIGDSFINAVVINPKNKYVIIDFEVLPEALESYYIREEDEEDEDKESPIIVHEEYNEETFIQDMVNMGMPVDDAYRIKLLQVAKYQLN